MPVCVIVKLESPENKNNGQGASRMKSNQVVVAASISLLSLNCLAAGFLEDSKSSVGLRTMYFENDNREAEGPDQRQTAQGARVDFVSGFSQGTVGFGLDVQGLLGLSLGGGIDHQSSATVNTVTPVDSDGSPVSSWTRAGGNLKAKYSKSELAVGTVLAPNLPILVANDSRVMPQNFEGGMLTSKEWDGLTLTGGKLTQGASRASSNYSGLAVSGGSKGSNDFTFVGGDWKPREDLLLQYYHSNLENYYSQDFFGLVHVFNIAENQSIKSDLRYFKSDSDGKNGSAGYFFNNAGGYADTPGKVDNNTWSAMFTYSLGSHAFMLGHQRVSNDGAMVYVSSGNVRGGNGSLEGQGGASVYLFTDSLINAFVRAGENTTYGQYSYDLAGAGVPGLKAYFIYLRGDDIKDAKGSDKEYSEWERDMRLDYVLQSGPLKNLAFSLRRGNFRTEVPNSQGGIDYDQSRLYVNYTYAFK
jgi:hypothetical protein